jgi:hypothetical protein
LGEFIDIPHQAALVTGQRDAGSQDQLATSEQVGNVRQLADVHPPHRVADRIVAREQPWPAASHLRQRQDLTNGWQHPDLLHKV